MRRKKRLGGAIVLSRYETAIQAAWEDQMEQLAVKIAALPKTRSCPAEKPLSVLKTGVYCSVRDIDRTNDLRALEVVLAYKAERHSSVDFKKNPFYLALLAVAKDGEIAVDFGRSISQYSRELLYAHRHDVPPEFLIGFLSQVGTDQRISDRLKRNELEPWYRADAPWVRRRQG